jgi:hypothetical protein
MCRITIDSKIPNCSVDKRDLGECTQRSGIPTVHTYLISGLKNGSDKESGFCINII